MTHATPRLANNGREDTVVRTNQRGDIRHPLLSINCAAPARSAKGNHLTLSPQPVREDP
jgi:hypothetical protein